MKRYVLFFSLGLLIFFCAQDPIARGDKAFDQGNYGEALQYYLEALKQQPDNAALKSKIASAYLEQGQKIYQRTKSIRAFEARILKAEKYISENPTPELKKILSETYRQLAMAYKNAKPENDYQRLEYFNKTLENLEKALQYDPENKLAAEDMQAFQQERFQEMYDKGMNLYKKAKREPINYIAAEYYLSRALKLKPEDENLRKTLRKVRQKYLNILDPGQKAPIAITDRLKKEGYLAFLVVVKNQTEGDLSVSAGNFYLVTDQGEAVPGKASTQFANPLKSKVLKVYEETEGVVTFPIKRGTRYVRLEFRVDGETLGYKNLP